MHYYSRTNSSRLASCACFWVRYWWTLLYCEGAARLLYWLGDRALADIAPPLGRRALEDSGPRSLLIPKKKILPGPREKTELNQEEEEKFSSEEEEKFSSPKKAVFSMFGPVYGRVQKVKHNVFKQISHVHYHFLNTMKKVSNFEFVGFWSLRVPHRHIGCLVHAVHTTMPSEIGDAIIFWAFGAPFPFRTIICIFWI
jgi:hypothetical protein